MPAWEDRERRRELVRQVPCPECEARAGESCWSGDRESHRISNHRARELTLRALSQTQRSSRRRLAREVRCPRCSAEPGEPCVSREGPRIPHHQERVLALRERAAAKPELTLASDELRRLLEEARELHSRPGDPIWHEVAAAARRLERAAEVLAVSLNARD